MAQSLSPAQLAAVLNGPALVIDGQPFVPQTHSPDQVWYYVCVVLSLVVSGLFLMARIYTKLFIVLKLEISDALAFVGFLLFIAMVAVGRVTVVYGTGVHQWHLRTKDMIDLLKWTNIAEIIYAPCICMVKVSILLQYIRIFSPSRKVNTALFYGTWAIICATTIFYALIFWITIFECQPREKIWMNKLVPGHCTDHLKIILATGFFNITSDIIMLLLPIRAVWKLQMPLRKKIGITSLFGTGLLAIFASIMRMYYTYQIKNGGEKADSSFNIGWEGLWLFAEIAFGIIVGSTISLPRFIQVFRPHVNQTLTNMKDGVKSGLRSGMRLSKRLTPNFKTGGESPDNMKEAFNVTETQVKDGYYYSSTEYENSLESERRGSNPDGLTRTETRYVLPVQLRSIDIFSAVRPKNNRNGIVM